MALLLVLAGCGGEHFSATPGPAGTSGAGGSSGAGASTSSAGGSSAGGAGSGGTAAGGSSAGGAVGAGGAAIVDAGPKNWCAGQQGLFCADFDEVTDVGTFLNSWTTYSVVGGDFSLDNGAGVPSPPNALRIKTSAQKNVQALVSQELAPFAKPPSRIRLEFSIRIDAGSNVGFLSGAAVVAIFMGAQVTDGAVALEIGNGPSLVAGYLEPASAGIGFNTATLPGAFPKLNQWAGRYALEITYAGNTDASRSGCLQVLVGGVPQLARCMALPPTLLGPSFVSVALGVYSGGIGATGDVELRFDNVLLTAQ